MARSEARKLSFPASPLPFGTKAETLASLEGVLRTAQVLPQYRFTVGQWVKNKTTTLKEIEALGWLKRTGAVARSTARGEDRESESLAGHFLSVLNLQDTGSLSRAVDDVIASYGTAAPEEQILVQPMVADVAASGVAFGVDPSNGSAYFVLNYDDTSGSTSSVTAGSSNKLKTFYCHSEFSGKLPKPLDQVVALLKELSGLFGTTALDVEFALDRKGTLYLFQCRRLAAAVAPGIAGAAVTSALELIEKKVKVISETHPYLLGAKTVLGVMPDWNPAEIIGVRPRPLALSLYKELVTDSIWAYQRDNYGYRNLRSFPLLVSLCGLPYIDVRVSFNSFVPSDVDPVFGEKLVNYYLDRLVANPSFHDKVEFEIVYTCYTLDLPQRLETLRKAGFNDQECEHLTSRLRVLTNKIIHEDTGLWKVDIEKIRNLDSRLTTIRRSGLDLVSKIYWILEDCKRYGTLPFAGLARAGFIAVQMLRSLVSVGVLTRSDYDNFMSSLETVSTSMGHDFQAMSRQAFLEKYGHLRPGTYDVLSARYDEEPDRYFDWSHRAEGPLKKVEPFVLSLPQLKKIETLLREHQLEHDVLGFFDFIRAAIEGRELAKFVFTKSLSESLSLLKELGEAHGISPEDCSFIDIHAIRSLYCSSENVAQVLRASIDEGKHHFALTRQLVLPPLIVKPEDVWAFELPANDPNFVTQRKVSGPVVFAHFPRERFAGNVLFIPSADPGYDWIFSHGIGGLVTMYGGVNSHMAIRAGELGIPAVIGAGEKLYNEWAAASVVEIDCLNRQVRVVK